METKESQESRMETKGRQRPRGQGDQDGEKRRDQGRGQGVRRIGKETKVVMGDDQARDHGEMEKGNSHQAKGNGEKGNFTRGNRKEGDRQDREPVGKNMQQEGEGRVRTPGCASSAGGRLGRGQVMRDCGNPEGTEAGKGAQWEEKQEPESHPGPQWIPGATPPLHL